MLQGRIACANVLSDLYAMGVVSCHNMLMLLAVSREFTDQERDVVIPLMMQGFQVEIIDVLYLNRLGTGIVGMYIQLAAGPRGDSPTAAPLKKNSGQLCALS
jgi:hypothetical protein